MPFFASDCQTLRTPLRCDGACAFVEIPACLFVPGAVGWSQVLNTAENALMMQFFLLWLEMLRSVRAYVVLETLVTNEFEGLHQSKLSRLVNVVGYRLWATLTASDARTLLAQVSVTLSENATEAANAEVHNAKRRRVEIVPEKLPYEVKVQTKAELIRLLKMYQSGRGAPFTDIAFAMPTADEWDNGVAAEAGDGLKTILDHLNMYSQFACPEYHDRATASDLYNVQHDPLNYVNLNASGVPCFYPDERLRNTGLIRAFKLGPGAFLEKSSFELMSHMLPQMEPTTSQLRAKLERVLSAVGSYTSLREKTREELIRTATSSDLNKFCDPYEFSAIVIDESSRSTSTNLASMSIEDITRLYPTAQELHDRNAIRLKYLASTKNHAGTLKFYSDMSNIMHLLFSGSGIDGIPNVYADLYKETHELYDSMYGEARWAQKARAILKTGNTPTFGYTGMSHMINKIFILARENLLLMPQQQMVFLLLWLRHFTATRHLEITCSFVLLCGNPDTGKSWAIKTFTECAAQSLIIREDSTSEMAGYDGNKNMDLKIRITDEYRRTKTEAKDSMSGTRDKNEQTRISSGIVRHSRLLHNPQTGEYKTSTSETPQRLLDYAGTNAPQDLVPAMASRITLVPVTSVNNDKLSACLRSGGIASSMATDEDVCEDSQACKRALRLISSLQMNYTALEAFGAVPPLDTTCYMVFLAIIETLLGKDTMPTRRKNDLLKMAHAVKVWNDVSMWHCRGLAERFKGDTSLELAWYASRNFLRMEDIVVAYSILEQSRSMDGFIEELMITCKLNKA